MKSYLMLLVVVLVLPWSAQSQQTSVNITTFNLKWFGIGGDPNQPQSEYRIKYVKNFIETYLKFTNVFVFEEIVVVSDIPKILPKGWSCVSYMHPQPQHQKVVVCGAPGVQLAKVSFDNNYTIEEAQAGHPNLRPAMRIDVIEQKSKRNLLTLVGVHLKAMPNETELRIKQAVEISKDLAKIPANRPIVITGDMNTFTKDETKLPEDDTKLILKGFNSSAKGILQVPHKPNTYTFRSPQYRNQLDHFYVRGALRVTAIPEVFPLCSATQNGSGYMNFEFYYKNVSDHCPVTMQIVVQ
jgi:hypothetical protein